MVRRLRLSSCTLAVVVGDHVRAVGHAVKVLVLVLSCRRPPYDALYDAQRRTWDSVEIPGVLTHYYWCDELATMPWRLKLALDEADALPYDLIFRTNSSSYVDKRRLLSRALTLPITRCYQGINNLGRASGAGVFLSRDATMVLRLHLQDRAYDEAEDTVVGDILQQRMWLGCAPGAERVDYWPRPVHVETQWSASGAAWNVTREATEADVRDAYHLRCKSDDGDREKDIAAMEIAHRVKGYDVI